MQTRKKRKKQGKETENDDGVKEMEELNYVLEKNFLRRSNDRKISEGNYIWQTSNGSSGSLFTKRQNVFSIRFRIYLTEIHEIFFEKNYWMVWNYFIFGRYRRMFEFRVRSKRMFRIWTTPKIRCIFLIIMYFILLL